MMVALGPPIVTRPNPGIKSALKSQKTAVLGSHLQQWVRSELKIDSDGVKCQSVLNQDGHGPSG